MVGFFRALEQKNPTAESVRLHAGAIRFGTALIILGIVATLLAGLSHWRSLRRLRQGQPPLLPLSPLSITPVMLIAILGLGGLWAPFSQ